MKKLLPLLLAVIIAGMACDQAEQPAPRVQAPPKPDLDAIREELVKAQYDYAEAWSNKDMDFMTNNVWAHDDDITIWGPMETDRVQGWEGPNGVKQWYQGAMDSMKEVNFTFTDLLIKVAEDGNSAVITYHLHNEFVDNDGNAGLMNPRVTVVKERRGDRWVQIHGDASYSVAQVKEKGLCD